MWGYRKDMEFPMQDFDIDEETDFLLGGPMNHGSAIDMETYCANANRNPHRRNGGSRSFCR